MTLKHTFFALLFTCMAIRLSAQSVYPLAPDSLGQTLQALITQMRQNSSVADSAEGGLQKRIDFFEKFWQDRAISNTSTDIDMFGEYYHGLVTDITHRINQPCTSGGFNGAWKLFGPDAVPRQIDGYANCVWASSTNPNYILAGTYGGLFRSTDGGDNWECITDNAPISAGVLLVDWIAVNPLNENTIYLGTSSTWAGGLTNGVGGVGILKSFDGGQSWQREVIPVLGSPHELTDSVTMTQKIYFTPDSSRIYAFCKDKVFTRTNGNPIGNWVNITPQGINAGWSVFYDLEFVPGNQNHFFIANGSLVGAIPFAGIWEATEPVPDANEWVKITTGFSDQVVNNKNTSDTKTPTDQEWERFELSIPSSTELYFIATSIFRQGSSKPYQGLYRHTIGGSPYNNWTRINNNLPYVVNPQPITFELIVSPAGTSNNNNVRNIYYGSDIPYQSTDGGLTFNAIGTYTPTTATNTHADIRGMFLQSATNSLRGINDRLFVANDGGISIKDVGSDVSVDGENTTVNINGNGLAAGHVWSIATSERGGLAMAGLWHSGFAAYEPWQTPRWHFLGGGDVESAMFDKSDNTVAYGVAYRGRRVTTAASGRILGAMTSHNFPSGSEERILAPPLYADEANRHYTGLTDMHTQSSPGSTWSSFSGLGIGNLPNLYQNGPITAVAMDPYAASFTGYVLYGRDHILRYRHPSVNLGNFANRTPPEGDGRPTTSLALDPSNPSRVWAGKGGINFNNVTPTKGRVYYSSNTGTTWIDVSKGLPARAAIAKIIFHEGRNTLYAATEVGIYKCDFTNFDPNATLINGVNPSVEWVCFNEGKNGGKDFPNAYVTDMAINYCEDKLYISTFGRNVWESTLYTEFDTTTSPLTTVISSNTTWNTTRFMKGSIRVTSGNTLTITNSGNSWPTIFMPRNSSIIVEAGAHLNIDSSTISNSCGPCMWKGIKLLGKNANQSLNGSIVLNNATIEHAIEAIESTGGAISSIRSSYINNSRSIYLHDYTGTGTVWYNANFTKDTFMVTDGFRGGAAHYFRSHVELNHVKNGARFMGCRFLNNFTADYWGTCTGVQAINAGFSIGEYCTTPVAPCASGNSTPSSFRGFRNGVWVEAVDWDLPARITKSIFDSCAIGVRLFNTFHTTIAQNSFTVGAGREVDLNMFECDKNIGIYATGAQYPIIEENDFNGELPSNPSTNFERIGTLLDNCVKNENNENYITVYRNEFDELEKACVSLGRNKSAEQQGYIKPGGLRYVCNTFTNNDADIYVISDGSGANRQGIQYYQRGGDPTTSNVICAGNEFNNGSATHISGDAARMLYFNDGNGFRNPTNISSNVMLTTTSVSTNSCATKYGALIDAPLEELIPDLKDIAKGQGILADTKTGDYEAQIDGGNTAGLIAYLGTKTSAESDEVYTTMWGYSPWLSQDALYTLAQSSILDADSLTEIMMANPEALTPEFVDELEILSPQPFMPEHFTQMDAAPGIFTARTTLLAEIATAKAEKDYYTSFLMSVMLDEDTIEADSVIAWYDYTNTVAAEYAKASFYASIGDYVSGEAVLTNLPSKFSLNTQQTTDHNAYSSLYTMLKTVAMDDRTTKQLNSTELGQLATWASNSSLGALVKNPVNVLNDNFEDVARLACVDLYSSSGKQAPKTRLSAYSRGLNSVVRAYPNPANEQVTFDYRLPRMEKNTVLVVNDITGREVYQMRLDKPTGTTVWNTRLLAPGVYIYRIRDAHSIIETGRISISR